MIRSAAYQDDGYRLVLTVPPSPQTMLPLKNTVLFPYLFAPLSVGRPGSVAAVEAALANEEKTIVALAQKDGESEHLTEKDFFTIGTNDLIQYCLAVDRTDDRVSDLYEPLHPAVLRLIRLVRRAAARHRIPVSLCGEMASDPALVGLLVGLGLTEFSMTPGAIPIVRQVVQELNAQEARRLAGHALRLATAAEIEQYLFDALAASAIQRSPSS